MKRKDNLPKITIPENELDFGFSRASGKGGQNLNKRSTRVQLFWSIGNSKIFDDKEKQYKVWKYRTLQKKKKTLDVDSTIL